jgi:hypothetical protein
VSIATTRWRVSPVAVVSGPDTRDNPATHPEAFMLYYLLKLAVSAGVVVAVSEIAKRHSGFAALIAALPLTSLLAFVWLRLEAAPAERIAQLSFEIFWLVLPSLALFLVLPLLLRHGLGFWSSLGLAVGASLLCYLALLPLLRRFGVTL